MLVIDRIAIITIINGIVITITVIIIAICVIIGIGMDIAVMMVNIVYIAITFITNLMTIYIIIHLLFLLMQLFLLKLTHKIQKSNIYNHIIFIIHIEKSIRFLNFNSLLKLYIMFLKHLT